mmetsp:Transcript_12214/g.28667  ORF Transcript_12214/g.28667 Transcript_12214/m.28667 type:complete len:333 (+) Transcript_12214:863-1861(+)
MRWLVHVHFLDCLARVVGRHGAPSPAEATAGASRPALGRVGSRVGPQRRSGLFHPEQKPLPPSGLLPSVPRHLPWPQLLPVVLFAVCLSETERMVARRVPDAVEGLGQVRSIGPNNHEKRRALRPHVNLGRQVRRLSRLCAARLPGEDEQLGLLRRRLRRRLLHLQHLLQHLLERRRQRAGDSPGRPTAHMPRAVDAAAAAAGRTRAAALLASASPGAGAGRLGELHVVVVVRVGGAVRREAAEAVEGPRAGARQRGHLGPGCCGGGRTRLTRLPGRRRWQRGRRRGRGPQQVTWRFRETAAVHRARRGRRGAGRHRANLRPLGGDAPGPGG